MTDRPQDDAPSTAGELRERLQGMGEPWFVDPRLGNEDPLPEYQRGGEEAEELPNPVAPGEDIAEILARQPPNNPFVRARWAESGLLSREELRGEPEGLRGAPLQEDREPDDSPPGEEDGR